jgi:hypothetical protein
MLNLIPHPETFKSGTRVLYLVSRNKDTDVKSRGALKISHDVAQFDRKLAQLMAYAGPDQRVYASAEPRDIQKAIRSLKMAQLDADYDEDPTNFYRRLDARWASALMQPSHAMKGEKLWLIDCDSEAEVTQTRAALEEFYTQDYIYEYASKTGRHILIKPFNLSKCLSTFQNLIHKNALMLWGY